MRRKRGYRTRLRGHIRRYCESSPWFGGESETDSAEIARAGIFDERQIKEWADPDDLRAHLPRLSRKGSGVRSCVPPRLRARQQAFRENLEPGEIEMMYRMPKKLGTASECAKSGT